jgi:hypothetical protein
VSQTHEQFSREEDIKGSSDRSFGFVFTAVFAIIGLLPLLGERDPRLWALGVAALFLVAALAHPASLAPLNRVWFKFGLVLHRIVSPFILGVLFYVVIVPTATLMRLFGKRPLQLELDPTASSYWIPRVPPGPAPESMKNQF